MIKKLRIDELEKGMYVSGFQKARSDKALFFMNNLLIKSDEELKEFYDYGYRSAYIVVNDPADSEGDPSGPADPGCESPGGLKTNLKGIEEYEDDANRPADQPADQRERAEGGHGPGPAKVGLEPPDAEAAPPGTTDMEAAPPGIETAFIGTTDIETAAPETPGIETASTSAETAESDAGAASPRTTGTIDAEATEPDVGAASPRTTGAIDAEATEPDVGATSPGTTGTTDTEVAEPDVGAASPRTTGATDAEATEPYVGAASPGTTGTTDTEVAEPDVGAASPRTTGATDTEAAEPDAGAASPGMTGATDTEAAESDAGAASPRTTGATDTETAESDVAAASSGTTEDSPSPSGQEGSPAQSSQEEAPARHIRLIDNPDSSAPEETRMVEVAEDLIEYREEIEEATKVRDDAEVLVRKFMHDKHGELQPERVHEAVGQMVDSIFRNRDALSSLVRLKSADDYTFAHCVNVCILSMAVSRQMGFAKETAHDLGVGAILHDIGKTCITEKTLKKPGPLSATELDEVRTHPALGEKLLLDADGIADASKYVVVQHHEKYNGTGYPSRKEGERIHVFARIAAVADVYDAMTSTRVYQKALPPDLVLQKMYMWRDLHFEPTLVERLIKCLGIYPIGTLVELNTGEIAVVTATNPNNPIKPAILVLFDENKVRIPNPIEVNLNSEMSRWVVESKDPEKFGIDIEDIIA